MKKLQALSQDESVELWGPGRGSFPAIRFQLPNVDTPETRDPVLLHHPTHKSFGYFGAVYLRDDRCIYRREEDRFNAVIFWAFLQDLRNRSQTAGRRVVVITDNARYHRARLHKDRRQEQQGSFRLDFLPPYSPDLNRIERVWELARRQCLRTIVIFPRWQK